MKEKNAKTTNYNTDDILISASVLSTYWEHGRNDMLDLLMPFLKYAIASTTKKNEKVPVELVTQMFKQEFGYYEIPINVVKTLLNRLSPKQLMRNHGEYYLIVSLSEELEDYKNKRIEKKERQDKVCTELANYLNVKIPGSKYDSNAALICLFSFFQRKGLFVYKETEQLNQLFSRQDRINYEIAQFVLEQNYNKSVLFDYLVEMVEGYFVSTAISYQNSSNSSKTKFKNMHCYLDTRIIINALGLHLPEELTKSAKEFVNMLRESGAEIYCFNHILSEIRSIIIAYKNCLNNSNYISSNTLELFDSMKYTSSDVDTYLSMLEEKIESLGIIIVDTPEYSLPYNEDVFVDHSKLQEELKSRMKYNPKSAEKASDNDCKSVESILLLRNGNSPTEIEKANYIFVSGSYYLKGIVNNFLGYNKDHIVPVVLSDTELSSWLWIRSYTTHKDFPKDQLLLNATLASEMPSSQFLDNLYEKIEIMKTTGKLTEDEAIAIRSDYFCRKELYKAANGDSSDILEESILDTRKRLKEQYLSDANKEIQRVSYQLKQERQKSNTKMGKAYESIRKAGEKRHHFVIVVGTTIATILYFIVMVVIVSLYLLTYQWIPVNGIMSIIACVLLIILDVFGYFQSVIGSAGTIKKLINKIAINAKNKAEDKKREDLAFLFDDENTEEN